MAWRIVKRVQAIGGEEKVNQEGGKIAGLKGDIITKDYLYDDKGTKHMSIKLDYAMLQKLAKEALDISREPVLVLSFNEVKRGCKDFAVIPLELWQELSGEK